MPAAHTAGAVRVTSIAPNSREQAIVDLSIGSKETSLHPGLFVFSCRADTRKQYDCQLRVGRYWVLLNYEATVEIVTIE